MRLHLKLILILLTITLVQNLSHAQSSYQPVTFKVSHFTISGDNPIGDKAYSVLRPYLGDQSGLAGLSTAADALEQAIISAGFSFHRVSLPPQKLTSGTVEFQIIHFVIGAINITGNKFFDQKNIEQSLPFLKSGSAPNTTLLSSRLKLANNHASKSVVLKFKESEAENAIDAHIAVQDQSPQLFFVTLDNTGSAETEEMRSTLGYQYGNLFNKDHSITATLTVAPQDTSATRQIGFNYHIPMYQHGANLDFLLSDSEVNSGDVADGAAVTGKGSVFGISYSRPLLSASNFDHQWSTGIQFKTFENDIELAGGSLITSDVVSFPFELGYGFSYNLKSGVISGGVDFAMNIATGTHNSDEDYAAVRDQAKSDWSMLKYNVSYDVYFAENWLVHAGLSGQSSSDLLISGEQFGVGGSNSLRGFEERSVTGDSGNQASLELWTPSYAGFRFLLFYDKASVELNTADSSEGVNFDLSSAGFGMHWAWKQQLSVSLEVGTIIDGGGTDTTINLDGDNKAHFNLVYRF